jgi:hypothetical protein
MLHQLHMFYTTEEIFFCSGDMVILGAILVCTKVQSAVSYFVSFKYIMVEEQSPTGGMDVSNQQLPLLTAFFFSEHQPAHGVYHYKHHFKQSSKVTGGERRLILYPLS